MKIPKEPGWMEQSRIEKWFEDVSNMHHSSLVNYHKKLLATLPDMPYRDRAVIKKLLEKQKERMSIGSRSARLWNACWCLVDGRSSKLLLT